MFEASILELMNTKEKIQRIFDVLFETYPCSISINDTLVSGDLIEIVEIDRFEIDQTYCKVVLTCRASIGASNVLAKQMPLTMTYDGGDIHIGFPKHDEIDIKNAKKDIAVQFIITEDDILKHKLKTS